MKHPTPAPLLAGLLWAATVGAQQYDLRVFGVEEGLPGATVNAIREDHLGRLWLDTDGGLCSYDGSAFTRWAAQVPGPPQEVGAAWNPNEGRWSLLFTAGPVPHFSAAVAEELVTRNGERWTGTLTGVEITDARGVRRITEANGLGSNDVRCLHQDRSGAIWIGTGYGGLTRYTGEAFLHFTERDGLGARVVTAIHRTPDGLIWFGTSNGNVVKWNGLGLSPLPRGPANASVRALGHLADGSLLIGTDDGLDRVDVSGHRTTVLSGTAVNRIRAAPDGSIWLGTATGVRVSTAHGFVAVGLQRLRVNDLIVAGDSVVIATAEGAYSVPLDNSSAQWRPVIAGDTLTATALARDRAGNLWIGTTGHGLLRYNSSGLARYTAVAHLAGNDVEQVLLDAVDNVWVGTRRGFDHLELDEAQAEVINATHFGREDGFIGTEAYRNACLLDADSALWFGTARGITRFDPRRLLQDPLPPRTLIRTLLLNYEPADWSRWCDSLGTDGLPIGLVLPHDRNHLTFEFHGIALAHPDMVRYQFLLEGQDEEWSPITATPRVTYGNLPPGSYTFKVIARNGSGVWNEAPTTFAFEIRPPLYRTTWFLVVSGLALLAAFLGFVRLRERRSRLERERLERTVKERTRQLEDEKQRSDQLLLNILPETTAAELKERGAAEARSYPACTVLFSDFQGFTTISEQMEASGVVAELDRFFRAFDRITTAHGLEKIKTIGDAYMCAAGVPNPSPTHALDAVKTALEMLQAVDRINAERATEGKAPWPIRIGLHSGPLVAGVVGEKKFAYDIWGGTVNLASRMESNGAAGRINISGATYALVMHAVQCTPRGPIKVKGKGEVQMYFVERFK